MYATRVLRAGMFRPTAHVLRPVPNEPHAAHTVSQRLRRLRKVPPELWPLAVVVVFAVGAAGYSCVRHLAVDKNIRLIRMNRTAIEAEYENANREHGEHGENGKH